MANLLVVRSGSTIITLNASRIGLLPEDSNPETGTSWDLILAPSSSTKVPIVDEPRRIANVKLTFVDGGP
jgi:predicted secreted protein